MFCSFPLVTIISRSVHICLAVSKHWFLHLLSRLVHAKDIFFEAPGSTLYEASKLMCSIHFNRLIFEGMPVSSSFLIKSMTYVHVHAAILNLPHPYLNDSVLLNVTAIGVDEYKHQQDSLALHWQSLPL